MVIYITPISNQYLWGKYETKENWWVAAVINSQIHFIRSIWTWVEFLGEEDIKKNAPGFFLDFFHLTDLKKTVLFWGTWSLFHAK